MSKSHPWFIYIIEENIYENCGGEYLEAIELFKPNN